MNSRRIDWIDLLRGGGMFLVIVGHTLQNDFVRAIIYSFHMPLFFALSGFCQNYCSRERIKGKILNNAKKLVLPAIIVYMVRLLTKFYSFQKSSNNVSATILEIVKTLFWFSGSDVIILGEKVSGIGIVWFLMVLFLSLVIFYIVQLYLPQNQTIVYFVLATIGVVISKIIYLPVSLDIALAVLPFIWLGHEAAAQRKVLLKPSIAGVSSVLYGVGFIICLSMKKSYLELAARRYPLYPMCFITACGAILFLFSVAKKLEEKFNRTCCVRILKFYGRNSLTLFTIHAMDYLWDNLYTTINSLGLEVLVRVLLDALICYGCVKLRNLKMKRLN